MTEYPKFKEYHYFKPLTIQGSRLHSGHDSLLYNGKVVGSTPFPTVNIGIDLGCQCLERA